MRKSIYTVAVIACALAVLASELSAQQRGRSPNNRSRSQGGGQQGPGGPGGNQGPGGQGGTRAARFPFEFRTIDGHGNNRHHPTVGAAETAFRRLFDPDYADSVGTPAGVGRPSARAVSNLVVGQSPPAANSRFASDFVWQWGQFVDHDLTETPIAEPAEAFDILVPTGDPSFDPLSTGSAIIPLDRSAFEVHEGVREQINLLTAYVDASQVYGSDTVRAQALRTLDGTGRLLTSPGDHLPYNTGGLPNAPSHSPTFFLAGDIRANEQVALTAIHTLFVREHNYWAGIVQSVLPGGSGDDIYDIARAIVGAEIQAITYREWLPVVLGPSGLPPYSGYQPQTDPSISNEFATAAYRFGHSMLSDSLLRIDASGAEIPAGHLPLAGAFFNVQAYLESGVDPILRGLAAQTAQAVDTHIVDALRNFLFGPPGSGGFDLAALNIQRGRDHGIPSFASIRIGLGLAPVVTFADISSDPGAIQRLAQSYASPQDVDAWVGFLSEPHVLGSLVGPTLHRVIRNQFRRLRDGDRFWYTSYMPQEAVTYIHTQTLATIIRRNSGIGSELSNNVFRTN